MTKTISASKAREQFADITDEVGFRGATYVIVKNGQPIADIVPHQKAARPIDLGDELEQDLKEFEETYKVALTELANK